MSQANIKKLDPTNYYGKTVAVLSDIHSNLDALQEAVDYIDSENIPEVIILGDLLTYGCQGNQVLALLKDLEARKPCLFITGNHEQFYFDLQAGKGKTSYSLPPFIEESVRYNLDRLECDLEQHFDWLDAVALGPVYLSHANPYEPGNWAYLNSEEECEKAAEVLREKGYQLGIFGHTHRKKNLGFTPEQSVVKEQQSIAYNDNPAHCVVLNPGSIGQPRGEGASFMVMQLTENTVEVEHITIKTEMNDYFAAVKAAGMSSATTEKLLSYFGDKK